MKREKFSIKSFSIKKEAGKKITMLTAYDYPFARLIDEAGIDSILVGDSLGMVVLGYENTLSVTMDEMIHHCKAVRRGTKHACLIGDMPYKSYETAHTSLKNAKRFIEEAGCDAVKLEGGTESIEAIKSIRKKNIPVLGHLGLTPQSIEKPDGYKVQGKSAEAAKIILNDALKLQEAGCFTLVLECIPAALAKIITETIKIPTIGIGAGPDCDGQILITNDMVGLFDKFSPKFAKKYINLRDKISDCIKDYKREVEECQFPSMKHSFSIKKEELEKLK